MEHEPRLTPLMQAFYVAALLFPVITVLLGLTCLSLLSGLAGLEGPPALWATLGICATVTAIMLATAQGSLSIIRWTRRR